MVYPQPVVIPAGRPGVAPFFLGRTPVTNAEYACFVESAGGAPAPLWTDPRFSGATQPVVAVTWGEAVSYCAWLSHASAAPWRLPTEAEWELGACGGLVAPATAWGDAVPPDEIPHGPLDAPWETGRGTPNSYGLCDIGTLVHEWCADWREPAPSRGPRRRASRGGSWRHAVRWTAPGASSSLPPDYRYADYGFRVLREAD